MEEGKWWFVVTDEANSGSGDSFQFFDVNS
jgi:hypothetical protein